MNQIATLCFTRNCDKHYWSIGYNTATPDIGPALVIARSFAYACEAFLPVKVKIEEISPAVAATKASLERAREVVLSRAESIVVGLH